jgi:hypothetical protein
VFGRACGVAGGPAGDGGLCDRAPRGVPEGVGAGGGRTGGIPVPAGFTITTETCDLFYKNGKKWPVGLEQQVRDNIAKLEKSMGEGAHIGLLFMMQPQGQGGFLFEINKKKEYRLRQIIGGAYRYISGSTKDQGWTRHPAVNEVGVPNILEVRTSKGAYDLYINNAYIRSFSEPNYRSGKLGLIIGPDTRGRADYFYIFKKGSITTPPVNPNEVADSTASSPDLIELAQSIISLKTRINELEEENTGLRRTISAMSTGEQDKDVQIRNGEKQIAALQEQLSKKDASIDSLTKQNAALRPYKDMIGNKDGDVIINLSKALKAEKEKNQKLEQELKLYKEKTGSTKSSTKTGSDDILNENPKDNREEPKKDPNVFSLPR